MGTLYTVEVNGFATLTFCDDFPLSGVQDRFNTWDDDKIRRILEDNVNPCRPGRTFAESGEVTFRIANSSEIARWAATVNVLVNRRPDDEYFDVRRTVTFLMPHLPFDWGDMPDELTLH